MKHTVLVACVGLFVLIAACGGEKNETGTVKREVRVVEVENVAEVEVSTSDDGRSLFLVPSSALFLRGQLEGVQVVGDEGIVSVRWVRTGNASGELVEVLSGLGKGEKVVAPYVSGVEEGFQVKVKQ